MEAIEIMVIQSRVIDRVSADNASIGQIIRQWNGDNMCKGIITHHNGHNGVVITLLHALFVL